MNITREEQNNRLLKVLEYAGVDPTTTTTDSINLIDPLGSTTIIDGDSIEELSKQYNTLLQQKDIKSAKMICGGWNSQSVDFSSSLNAMTRNGSSFDKV